MLIALNVFIKTIKSMPMKTIFTFKILKSLLLSFAIVLVSINLEAQTSHKVSVVNNKFDPKEITINAGDTVIWTNSQGSHNVDGLQSVFPNNPESFGNAVGSGWTYQFVFTKEGTYNYHCDPHAGFGMVGKVFVNPKPYTLTVNFAGMNPHLGETLWVAVIEQSTMTEVARVKKTIETSFSLEFDVLQPGKSYNVDLFSDDNDNGKYDAPPTDHAWRLQVNDVTGNTSVDFSHDTNFTDIAWKYKLTVHFTGMTPHLGEKLTLFLVWADTGFYQDTLVIPSVSAADFDLISYEIKPGFRYSINFYADHNKNGVYNSPPTDHAWQIFLDNVKGDTIVNFAHNTNFTDILPTTGTKITDAQKIRLFPNPATQYTELLLPPDYSSVRSLKVYSITGSVVDVRTISENTQQIRYDLSGYKNGVYFMEINTKNRKDILKFIKQ